MDIISVSNQKGGVGKTGVSFNLGSALALNHGKNALLIDFDPQANLSEYLKFEPNGSPALTQLVMTVCLPSLGTLLINALTAANKLLIPVQTQKFSLDGLQSLNGLYEQIRQAINPNITMLGVLPTMVDRTTVTKNALLELHEKYGDMLFDTHISKSVEAAKSSENGIPLCITGHK